MSAPYVDSWVILPSLAGADPHIMVTPLIADTWELLLREAGALSDFSDLPVSLCISFRISVTSTIPSIIIHPHHKSATDMPEVILKHIAKEMQAGRYSGPFSPTALHSIIPNFCASLPGVVDKPLSPGDLRIIQDLLFPCNHSSILSVNAQINASEFTCSWGFLPDIISILGSLPEGSQSATFDMDAACH